MTFNVIDMCLSNFSCKCFQSVLQCNYSSIWSKRSTHNQKTNHEDPQPYNPPRRKTKNYWRYLHEGESVHLSLHLFLCSCLAGWLAFSLCTCLFLCVALAFPSVCPSFFLFCSSLPFCLYRRGHAY